MNASSFLTRLGQFVASPIRLAAMLVAATGSFCVPAFANVVWQLPISFTAPGQSLWGSGSSADFGASGGGSLVSGIGYSYSIGASSGTVSAQFQGGISVAYTPSLNAPGATSISLSFVGDAQGGHVASDLGAWANVSILGIKVLDRDYGLNIDQSYPSQLGRSGSGSDTATLGNSGVTIGVGSAGVNFNIEQTDTLTADAITGILRASLRGTSTSRTQSFTLAGSGMSLDLDLSDIGIWDMYFQDLTLENSFSASFSTQIEPYVTYTSGIQICYKWGLPYPCGTVTSEYSITLADIPVYDPTSFALAFGRVSPTQGFSIEVGDTSGAGGPTIPEPGTLALLGIGFAGLACLRNRKCTPVRPP